MSPSEKWRWWSLGTPVPWDCCHQTPGHPLPGLLAQVWLGEAVPSSPPLGRLMAGSGTDRTCGPECGRRPLPARQACGPGCGHVNSPGSVLTAVGGGCHRRGWELDASPEAERGCRPGHRARPSRRCQCWVCVEVLLRGGGGGEVEHRKQQKATSWATQLGLLTPQAPSPGARSCLVSGPALPWNRSCTATPGSGAGASGGSWAMCWAWHLPTCWLLVLEFWSPLIVSLECWRGAVCTPG